MKNGAHIFILVPYKENLEPYEKIKEKYEFTHLRSIDEKYVEKMAEKVGLKVVRMVPFLAQVPGQTVFNIVRMAQFIVPDNILCKIFKPSSLFVELCLKDKKIKR